MLSLLGPPRFVDIAPGADRVLAPTAERGCWGIVPPKNSCRRHCRCEVRARRGRLTCLNHRRLEGAAQRLKASTEDQEKSA